MEPDYIRVTTPMQIHLNLRPQCLARPLKGLEMQNTRNTRRIRLSLGIVYWL